MSVPSTRAGRPLRLMMGSYLALIAAGTALLSLPWSTPPERPITFIDALFTSASAACVTGLVVRDTGDGFTLFGQLVILGLIQLGGLGIMTFSLIMASYLGSRLSLDSRFLITQTLAGRYWEDYLPLLRLVLRFTLLAELAGALLLFVRLYRDLGPGRAAYSAIFHSISAFCNAGFSLSSRSFSAYRDDIFVNGVVCALIVLGGLGFVVVWEVVESRRGRAVMSLHSRLSIWVSGVLLLAGAGLIWWIERDGLLAGLKLRGQVLASFFQSVSARTAGFNTVEIGQLAPATLFLIAALMFIGGCPGSCAGGIKTTTFGTLVLTAWNRLHNRRNVNAFRRSIGSTTIANTISLSLGGMALVCVGLFLVLVFEDAHITVQDPHGTFAAYLFETVSALGTVGLSCGVTSSLTPASRILFVVLMYLGRLGPLTVATALATENPRDDWQYPEEDVMVG